MTSSGNQDSYPLVSVIVPTYNCADFLEAALESIFIQDYQNTEVILVDDGSMDSTIELALRFKDKIKLIKQDNKGPASARNAGVRESKGQYLAFLDGDDLWLQGKLKLQMECIAENPEIGIVYGAYRRWMPEADGRYLPLKDIDSKNTSMYEDPTLSGWIYHKLLLDSIIHIITAVIPRSLYDSLDGFDESLRTGSDYDFWLRASRLSQAKFLPTTLAIYRINRSSISHIVRPFNQEHKILLSAIQKFGLEGPSGFSVDAAALSERLFRLCFDHGYVHFWRGSAKIAASAFAEALQYRARNPKAIAYLLLSRLRSLFSWAS